MLDLVCQCLNIGGNYNFSSYLLCSTVFQQCPKRLGVSFVGLLKPWAEVKNKYLGSVRTMNLHIGNLDKGKHTITKNSKLFAHCVRNRFFCFSTTIQCSACDTNCDRFAQ